MISLPLNILVPFHQAPGHCWQWAWWKYTTKKTTIGIYHLLSNKFLFWQVAGHRNTTKSDDINQYLTGLEGNTNGSFPLFFWRKAFFSMLSEKSKNRACFGEASCDRLCVPSPEEFALCSFSVSTSIGLDGRSSTSGRSELISKKLSPLSVPVMELADFLATLIA